MSAAIHSAGASFRLGIIGDLHTHWDSVDVAQFANLDYDLLFFTGDLGGGTQDSSLRVARGISGLRQPTLVMPGNNDTGDIDQLAAELAHQSGVNQLMSIARNEDQTTSGITLCGYSLHPVRCADMDIDIIAARPHSMGGPDLSFPEYMQQTYGVLSMADSIARLRQLVDQAQSGRLVFLGHNGPLGMGEQPDDMWGCDFRNPPGGDWGDPDLAAAIEYAVQSGKQVLAVIAGHMHLRTKQGSERPWLIERNGITHINASRVPRIFSGKDDVYRHHVALTIGANSIEAEEILLPEYG
ncbi:MAG: metallophosphoesterase [Halioglobus sp.]